MLAIIEPTKKIKPTIAYNADLQTTTNSRRRSDLQQELSNLREQFLLAEIKNDDQLVVANQLKTALKNNLANYQESKSQLLRYQSRLKQYKKAFKQLKVRSKKAVKLLKQSRSIMDSQKITYKSQQNHLDIMESLFLDVIQIEVKRTIANNHQQTTNYAENKPTALGVSKISQHKIINKVKLKISELNKSNLSLVLKSRFIRLKSRVIEKFSLNKPVAKQTSSPAWVKTSSCLPLRSGLYYISNGVNSDIALFNQQTQEFSKTHNEIFVDFWCIDHGEILPPSD